MTFISSRLRYLSIGSGFERWSLLQRGLMRWPTRTPTQGPERGKGGRPRIYTPEEALERKRAYQREYIRKKKAKTI